MNNENESPDKKHRAPGRLKLTVMNSDSYLYTMEEAALINRLNRNKFRDDFLNLGFEIIKRNGKEYIRHDEIKAYHAHYTRIFRDREFDRGMPIK